MQNCSQRDAVSNHFGSPVRNKTPEQQDDSGKTVLSIPVSSFQLFAIYPSGLLITASQPFISIPLPFVFLLFLPPLPSFLHLCLSFKYTWRSSDSISVRSLSPAHQRASILQPPRRFHPSPALYRSPPPAGRRRPGKNLTPPPVHL